MDRVGQLEGGDARRYLVQLSDHIMANEKLKDIIEGIIQMTLKHWQAWGINHLLGSLNFMNLCIILAKGLY